MIHVISSGALKCVCSTTSLPIVRPRSTTPVSASSQAASVISFIGMIADAKRLTLTAKVKDATKFIGVEVGNGVENSWRGYFSHGARGTTIVVDAERWVPLEEQTGATTIRYSDWQEVGPGKWVPRQVDVVGRAAHYRMHFAWLGDAVWLAESSESIGPEGTVTLTRAQNVKVNGRQIVMAASNVQQRSRETARSILVDARSQSPLARWRPDRLRLAAAV